MAACVDGMAIMISGCCNGGMINMTLGRINSSALPWLPSLLVSPSVRFACNVAAASPLLPPSLHLAHRRRAAVPIALVLLFAPFSAACFSPGQHTAGGTGEVAGRVATSSRLGSTFACVSGRPWTLHPFPSRLATKSRPFLPTSTLE